MPVRIRLGHKRHALIDDDDAERVARYDWRAISSGKTFYAKAETKALGVNWRLLHRYIMDAQPGEIVDHISGNGLDCRKSNLRKASPRENSRNSHKTASRTTSRFKGVHWLSCERRWHASIGIGDSVPRSLGVFDSEEDAARAYDAAALEHFGEFARTNAMMGLYEGMTPVDERLAPIVGVPTIATPDLIDIRPGLAGMPLSEHEAKRQRRQRQIHRHGARLKAASQREKRVAWRYDITR